MEFSTLVPDELGDVKELGHSVSLTPINVTFSEDLLPLSSQGNDTGTDAARDTTSLILAVCITALYSLICVVGLLGNVLVMYGVVRYTKMKTATNIYIFNLALADALATSTLPFQSAKYLMRTWPFGELLCKVVIAIDYYNMFTSIFTLTMMSVDRYIAVCHPVRALDFRTPAKAKLINVCIWILASAVGVPVMIIAVTKVTDKGSKEKDRNMRRITRMVLVVVAAFIVCWTPIHIFIIVKTMVDIDHKDPLVMATWHLCIALGYTNSSLNPVLYAFLDENFKRCFRDFCLPYRSRLEQNSFSRARNSTREPASVCAPVGTEGPPA
ncbi:delta-type opioid receptor-like [Solea senegalensis]|uniref:Delta-type opioid receptor-like n=1 Tax=Solea senegalensis TaxID=28829 RepID=A0AAV6PW69_SOLSE|nr:delta-type opioid receptor-like isoform X2 [Solea senegalensis]KAG7475703.1 delta-type opioid receptor-like [Solea senegalensis]